ncbi:Chemokine binding protein [Eptesipox virus]|uniref:Chemokine binding protein n=1 Tax=Eptesipox virus TaxID=1329402 RepID=A0A220T6J5_9POXV|nr:Chemokine binding protein [Eptesipox virus]ASK51341.1 Chemokine binding protein [Eptesipox virus]WAH71099.1 chemokine binding protein [Eptesipox virus]
MMHSMFTILLFIGFSSNYAKPIKNSVLRNDLEHPELFTVCDRRDAYPGVSLYLNITLPKTPKTVCSYEVDKVNTNLYKVKYDQIEVDIDIKHCHTSLGFFYMFVKGNTLFAKIKTMDPWASENVKFVTQRQLAHIMKECRFVIHVKNNKNIDIQTIKPMDSFSGDMEELSGDDEDEYLDEIDVPIYPITFSSSFLKRIHDFVNYSPDFGLMSVTAEKSFEKMSIMTFYGDMCENLKTSFVTSGGFDRLDFTDKEYFEYPYTYNYENYLNYFYELETTVKGTFCTK